MSMSISAAGSQQTQQVHHKHGGGHHSKTADAAQSSAPAPTGSSLGASKAGPASTTASDVALGSLITSADQDDDGTYAPR